MSLATKNLGQLGEKLAVNLLKNERYSIIEKNWRSKIGEIDLIAKKDGVTVFVEVKTIYKNKNFVPEDHFTNFKINKLYKLAQTYFLLKKLPPENYRFDLIAVELFLDNEDQYEIRHYENVIEDSTF